jgi:hypothetical protein
MMIIIFLEVYKKTLNKETVFFSEKIGDTLSDCTVSHGRRQ